MPRPHCIDLRKRAICSVGIGLSCRETVKRFQVSVSFVIALRQRWCQRTTVAALAFGGHKTSVLSAAADQARVLVMRPLQVATEPEMTIGDLCGSAGPRRCVGQPFGCWMVSAAAWSDAKKHCAPKSKAGRT